MKNLLAVIGDGNAGPVLEAALMTARRFNSHIVGLHALTTEYAVVFGGEMGFSISSEVDRTLEREGHERRDQARRLFREFMAAHDVPVGGTPPGYVGPSASWREEDGRQNAIVGMTGRVYDMIFVEQPEKLASIAETTLTVALGMPFLVQAKHVVIVAVGPQHMPEPGPTGDELARTLERHGIDVSLRTAYGRQKPQGESFLKEAMEAGADLMLKGAYTQSRIRQMIFGGATRHMIMESKIPVLMAR